MSVAAQSLMENVTYEDLYKRWEQGNWSAYDIDFSGDRIGWDGLTDIQRRSAMWIYSMFFYGEDRVADTLAPYITAAPTEEQSYFLATQQVDEVRHSVFFHRFFKEVIGVDGDSLQQTLASTLPQLNWGYHGIFDRLDTMAEELRKDRSLPKYAQAITLYHLIVEGSLAQPGQHFIEDFFASEDTMPGFTSGMANVSKDEQRHIGFGVKVLSELLAEGRPGCRGEPRGGDRAAARDPALRRRRLHAPQLGPRVHRVLRLLARGHLRLRAEADPPALADDRLSDRGDAARRLPLRPRDERARNRHQSGQAAGSGRRSASPAWSSRSPRRSCSGSSSTSSPAPPTPAPPTARRSSTSGASATPTPGTWSSTTARPGRSREKRRARTSPSRRAGPTGCSRPGRG